MAGRTRLETLNLLRGFAAFAVLAWHFPGIDGARYWSAYLSVDLFFVLSGVVVAFAYEARLRGGWRLRRFVAARIIRLWPLYLLGTAIGAAAVAAATLRYGSEAWRFKSLSMDVLRALFLWPRVARGAGVAFPLDPPAWSLFCEFVVNLLYGAVLVRWRSRWLGAVAGLGAVLMTVGVCRPGVIDAGLNLGALADHLWIGLARALFSFPVGVLIYRGWAAGLLPRMTLPPVVLCGIFCLILVAVPARGEWAVPAGLAAVVIGFPLLVVAAVQVEPVGRLVAVARVTADLSYPIYAIHDALYLAAGLAVASSRVPATPAYLSALAGTLLLAPIADRWADRPVRRFLTRLAEMPRAAVTEAPPL